MNPDSDLIKITNTIKLLTYKENPKLLEKVNFDDDNVFLEPLLFAYFNIKKNSSNTFSLNEIMQGYFKIKEKIFTRYITNEDGIAYIPNLGYFKNENKEIFETSHYINNSTIEVIKYKTPLLTQIYKSSKGVISSKDIVINNDLFNKNILFLNNGFELIKNNALKHYLLIEQCCKKCILFKSDPSKLNSFATINAHGIAFFNAYQHEYEDVFFVDDIAHQTGHIIMNVFCHERKEMFKINENQTLEILLPEKGIKRTFYVFFHALYTYYTTLLCLDNCLKNKAFNEIQEREAIARIGFYLTKFERDIERFKKIETNYNGIENILTPKGIQIYSIIHEKYQEIAEKWNSTTMQFNYSNQAYNFAIKLFNQVNK